MTKVLTFGTFDILHEGHKHYLEEAKSYGTELIVVIALDETVQQVKNHPPKHDQNTRKQQVEQLGIASQVLLGHSGDKHKIIEEVNPDIIALGYDQKAFTENLLDDLTSRNLHAKIIRMHSFHPDKYKSSLLR